MGIEPTTCRIYSGTLKSPQLYYFKIACAYFTWQPETKQFLICPQVVKKTPVQIKPKSEKVKKYPCSDGEPKRVTSASFWRRAPGNGCLWSCLGGAGRCRRLNSTIWCRTTNTIRGFHSIQMRRSSMESLFMLRYVIFFVNFSNFLLFFCFRWEE